MLPPLDTSTSLASQAAFAGFKQELRAVAKPDYYRRLSSSETGELLESLVEMIINLKTQLNVREAAFRSLTHAWIDRDINEGAFNVSTNYAESPETGSELDGDVFHD